MLNKIEIHLPFLRTNLYNYSITVPKSKGGRLGRSRLVHMIDRCVGLEYNKQWSGIINW